MRVPSVQLNNGRSVPMLGYGGYFGEPQDFSEDVVMNSICSAIDTGYRHIDTAYLYYNEPYIGRALARKVTQGTIAREDMFITSKLSFFDHAPESVQPAVEKSIRDLGCEYLDLYLMHFPYAAVKTDCEDMANLTMSTTNDYVKTWRAMEKCVEAGLVRSIGVSNFNSKQIQNVLDNCKIKPVVNQVEVQPYFSNSELVKYCQGRDVVITAYTPLGQPHAAWCPSEWVSPLQDPIIKEIAVKYKKSPAQIALRLQIQRGIVVLAKALGADRQMENIEVFDFELDTDDMETLLKLNKNNRANTEPLFKGHKDYPFNESY